MTKFTPGQAVEQLTENRHLRGKFWAAPEGTPTRNCIFEIEEIVRGHLLHFTNVDTLSLVEAQAGKPDDTEAIEAACK
jgi:hypothetical protein